MSNSSRIVAIVLCLVLACTTVVVSVPRISVSPVLAQTGATATAPVPPAPPSLPPPTTPSPTATPLVDLQISHDLNAGTDSILDLGTNNGVTTSKYEFGTVDAAGFDAPPGSYFFWTFVDERYGGKTAYQSSIDNFQLRGDDGAVYHADYYGPLEDASLQTLLPTPLGPGPGSASDNTGWIKFVVPAVDAVYTLLWNEGGTIPFSPYARILIGQHPAFTPESLGAKICPADNDRDDHGLPPEIGDAATDKTVTCPFGGDAIKLPQSDGGRNWGGATTTAVQQARYASKETTAPSVRRCGTKAKSQKSKACQRSHNPNPTNPTRKLAQAAADTPTPVATPAASSTPAPIDTPVPTATATPLPGPPFRTEHNPGAGVDVIVDNQTHVGATVGAYEVGDVDRSNVYATFGHWFFWLLGQEENFGVSDFVSDPADFELVGSDGTVYLPLPGYPVDAPDEDYPMLPGDISRNSVNNGWLQFTLPSHADIYTVLWNEGGAIPFTPMGKFKIEAGVPFPGPLGLPRAVAAR
jgi:hypothetical protein